MKEDETGFGSMTKVLGQLACSLAESVEADLGMVVIVKGRKIGMFMGGEKDTQKDKIISAVRETCNQLTRFADSLVSGMTIMDDGKTHCYTMDHKTGEIKSMTKENLPGKDDGPSISLLS